ncbi:MAG: glycine cleavage system aminomethyltransferase GcvT [Myxococcota bacterium]
MRTTALYQRHVELGAQMTDFAGYQMPVRYSGDKLEHMVVRENAGIFDVSHMGEVWIEGLHAEAEVSKLLNHDASKHAPGKAFYSVIMNDHSGIVDDVIAYKFSPQKFLICVNASNRFKDFKWIKAHTDANVRDASEAWSQIAIQGPNARAIAAEYLGSEILDIPRFGFIEGEFIIARTGYTGEDGFEIFCPNYQVASLWDTLCQKATPCGLAARDTLRLEAGMCLYGHELADDITPWEAGLGWCLNLPKQEPKRRLVGLNISGNAIARADYEVCTEQGDQIGWVTSGTKTPYLNRAIAMAYIDTPHCDTGSAVYVKVRGRLEPAYICKLPFYRRDS